MGRIAPILLALSLAASAGCSRIYCDTGETADTADEGVRRRSPDAGRRPRAVRPDELATPKSGGGK